MKMTEEQWEKFCVVLQGNIDSLCSHEKTRQDCYEDIKDLCKPYMFYGCFGKD
jgi:hypothetical protein